MRTSASSGTVVSVSASQGRRSQGRRTKEVSTLSRTRTPRAVVLAGETPQGLPEGALNLLHFDTNLGVDDGFVDEERLHGQQLRGFGAAAPAHAADGGRPGQAQHAHLPTDATGG